MNKELKLKATLDISDVSSKARQIGSELNAAGNSLNRGGDAGPSGGLLAFSAGAGAVVGQAISSALGVVIRDLRQVFTDFVREEREVLRISRSTGVPESFARGGRTAWSAAGVNESAFNTSIESLIEARGRAIDGDRKPQEAFAALALDYKKPVELIVEEFGKQLVAGGITEKARYYSRTLFGASSDETLRALYSGAGANIGVWAHPLTSGIYRAGEQSRQTFEALGLQSPVDWAFGALNGKDAMSVKNIFGGKAVTPPSTYLIERQEAARDEQRKNDEHDYKIRLSLMNPQARMQALLGDEQGLLGMERYFSDPVLREQIRAKRMGVAQELFSMMPEPGPTSKITGDQYSRMGLFIGGSGDNLPDLSKQQVEQLRQVNEKLAQLPSQIGMNL